MTNKWVAWWHSAMFWMYERLTQSDAIQQVDLIFVMAGRIERKPYGMELFRTGLAPRLILSIGRFEVSKMKPLQLPGFEELIVTRDRTPPNERHFFMDLDRSGVRISKVDLARWNTYGEALALHRWLKGRNMRRVMVVSTDIHLRRVAFTFSKVFRHVPVQFLYCPVPSMFSSLRKEHWWTSANDRRYVVDETIKMIAYRIILTMPGWAIRWFWC